MFYVYEWFIKDTNEIIYVGKGCKRRYLSKQHNSMFREFIKRFECNSRIIAYYENEEDAFKKEFDRINELKQLGQCVCNKAVGGFGGGGSANKSTSERWTAEARQYYSAHNVMKSEAQRTRMSINNPMKKEEVALRVGMTKRKPLIIGDMHFSCIKEAAACFKKSEASVAMWAQRGYTPFGERAFYEEEGEKADWKKLFKCRRCTNSIPVIVDGFVCDTIKEACRIVGADERKLKKYISVNKPINGHVCVYANQQPSHGNSEKVPWKAQRLMGEDRYQ